MPSSAVGGKQGWQKQSELQKGTAGRHRNEIPYACLVRRLPLAFLRCAVEYAMSNVLAILEPAPPPAVRPGMLDLLQTFFAGRNERTLRAYRNDLEQFRVFVDAPTAADAVNVLLASGQGAANGTVLRYRAHLSDSNRSPATINRALSALRALLKLARMLGVVPWSLDVPNVPAESYRDTRGPGVAGVKRVLATTNSGENEPMNLRDRAILRLLYDLGLRRAEVASLDVGDVDLARNTVAVIGKRRTEKTLLSLAAPTKTVLSDWLRVRGGEPGPLFLNFDHADKGQTRRLTGTSIYRIVHGRGQIAGIKVAPHGLRHTAITEACKAAQAAGMPLEEVMDFSRHRDVKILMIYRDRERNVQGQIAEIVAQSASAEDADE
ncbi:MAG: tyrosine-type recombinase/integrase [Akkermansiaceae bacterium]|nr:tyrosine-type recombinase/integrase [Armatimonadota bacterium]